MHLHELRRRMIYVVLIWFLLIICLYMTIDGWLHLLLHPLKHALNNTAQGNRPLIYTGLMEAFTVRLKLTFWLSLSAILPWILWQAWKFIAPGLYDIEKKTMRIMFIACPFLFYSGCLLAYSVICPLAWIFLLGFETTSAYTNDMPLIFYPKISEYCHLVGSLMSIFGIAFQFPLGLILAIKCHIVTVKSLKTKRRFVFLIISIVSAIITPPDFISPLGLIIPLYGMFEAALWLSNKMQRKQC